VPKTAPPTTPGPARSLVRSAFAKASLFAAYRSRCAPQRASALDAARLAFHRVPPVPCHRLVMRKDIQCRLLMDHSSGCVGAAKIVTTILGRFALPFKTEVAKSASSLKKCGNLPANEKSPPQRDLVQSVSLRQRCHLVMKFLPLFSAASSPPTKKATSVALVKASVSTPGRCGSIVLIIA